MNKLKDQRQKKLAYFEQLLGITRNFLNKHKQEEIDLSKIDKFFNERSEVINQIQQLEKENKAGNSEEEKQINKQISKVARKLVDFDDRIFDILSKKKKKMIKDIKNVTDIKNRSPYNRGKASKLVDIEG